MKIIINKIDPIAGDTIFIKKRRLFLKDKIIKSTVLYTECEGKYDYLCQCEDKSLSYLRKEDTRITLTFRRTKKNFYNYVKKYFNAGDTLALRLKFNETMGCMVFKFLGINKKGDLSVSNLYLYDSAREKLMEESNKMEINWARLHDIADVIAVIDEKIIYEGNI